MSPQRSFICFSDIDGTLVHYLDGPEQLQEVCLIVPRMHAGVSSDTRR